MYLFLSRLSVVSTFNTHSKSQIKSQRARLTSNQNGLWLLMVLVAYSIFFSDDWMEFIMPDNAQKSEKK